MNVTPVLGMAGRWVALDRGSVVHQSTTREACEEATTARAAHRVVASSTASLPVEPEQTGGPTSAGTEPAGGSWSLRFQLDFLRAGLLVRIRDSAPEWTRGAVNNDAL